MQKLIILDYRNGVVVVLPSLGNEEEQVTAWCANNQTAISGCEWMGWDGQIRYEE